MKERGIPSPTFPLPLSLAGLPLKEMKRLVALPLHSMKSVTVTSDKQEQSIPIHQTSASDSALWRKKELQAMENQRRPYQVSPASHSPRPSSSNYSGGSRGASSIEAMRSSRHQQQQAADEVNSERRHNSEQRVREGNAPQPPPRRPLFTSSSQSPLPRSTRPGGGAPTASGSAAESHSFSKDLQFSPNLHSARSTGGKQLSFNYELTSPEDLTQFRAEQLKRSFTKLVEMLESEGRIFDQHSEVVEVLTDEVPSQRFVNAHNECIRLLSQLHTFEEVVVQSLLRDASRQQRSVVPYPPPQPPPEEPYPLLPKSIQTFVEMELLCLRCQGSPVDVLWTQFKSSLPLNDNFYDVKDFLNEWGPEWTSSGGSESSSRRKRVSEEATVRVIQQKVAIYLKPVESLIRLRVDWGKYVPWDQVLACTSGMNK